MGENDYQKMKKVYGKLRCILSKGATENEIIIFFNKNIDYFDVSAKTYLKILYESGTMEINKKGLIKKVA